MEEEEGRALVRGEGVIFIDQGVNVDGIQKVVTIVVSIRRASRWCSEYV